MAATCPRECSEHHTFEPPCLLAVQQPTYTVEPGWLDAHLAEIQGEIMARAPEDRPRLTGVRGRIMQSIEAGEREVADPDWTPTSLAGGTVTLTNEQRDLEARLDEAVQAALAGGIPPALVAEWVTEQITDWQADNDDD